MKKFPALILLIFPAIACFSQTDSLKTDSVQKMEITDKDGYIEMRMGDSIIRFSYEELYFDNLWNGVNRANEEDYNGAIGFFNAALLYKNDEKQVYYYRGLAFYYLGDFENALIDFNRAILLDPAYADAYDQRGIVYSRTDRNELAKTDFNAAIKYDPTKGMYPYNLGVAYLMEENYEKACENFKKASKLEYKRADELIREYCD